MRPLSGRVFLFLSALALHAACGESASPLPALPDAGKPADSETTVTLASSANPALLRQAVAFTATVTSSAGTPTGTVTFNDGATALGIGTLDATGRARLETAALSVGSHAITAVYVGAAGFAASTSVVLAQTVLPEQGGVAIASSITPSSFGQSVTFTVTVLGPAGAETATGEVTFKDGTTVFGTAALDESGKASLDTARLSVGTHSVTAAYGGDANFAASSSDPIIQTVNKSGTTVSLASDINPVVLGQVPTLTATVTAVAPGAGIPTGIVTFSDGSALLWVETLDASGSATFTPPSLKAGAHLLTATYVGDASFTGSTSSPLSLNCHPAATTTNLGSDSDTFVYGQPVAIVATVAVVAPGTGEPMGTVTFKDGSDVLGTAPVDATGAASLTTSKLAVGAHSITAAYAGSSDYQASASAELSVTVNPAATRTTVASDTNPSSYGESFILTATVTAVAPGAGLPTGTVTFMDGSSRLGSAALDALGSGSFSLASLDVGAHSITAVYSGDARMTASTSDLLAQTILPFGAMTVSLVSSANPSVAGQTLALSATVNPALATGTVTFRDDGTTLGTATLDGTTGKATFSISSLAVGTHAITASYEGDGRYGPATSGVLAQVVGQASTSIAFSSSPNPSTYGSPVTLTAKVNVTAPGSGTPTGTVVFHDSLGAPDVSATLDATGTATITTSTLSRSEHHWETATYGGDVNFKGSASEPHQQVVDRAQPTTNLVASPGGSTYGQLVVFTATVFSPGGTPTGSVVFQDGSTTLGTATLDASGQASFSTAALGGGLHSISAAYSGDANFAPAMSPPTQHDVGRAATTTILTSSRASSLYSQVVSFVATVSSAAPTPTGTVVFKDGATTLGSGVVDPSGKATLAVATLGVGAHSIIADYGGDADRLPSNSAPLSQTVSKTPTSIWITSTPNPSNAGQPVTFTVYVTGQAPDGLTGVPTGTVTFVDPLNNGGVGESFPIDRTGKVTITRSDLVTSPGHWCSASYAGDGAFDGSVTSGYQHIVVQPALTLGATYPTPSVQLHVARNGTLSLTATLTDSATYLTDTFSWSLNAGAAGQLGTASRTSTGTTLTSTVTYRAPAASGLPDAVTVSVGGLTASATIRTDPPMAAAGRTPLRPGITRLTRVVDFAIAGGNLDNSYTNTDRNNLFFQAPYSARGKFDGNPTGKTDSTLLAAVKSNGEFATNRRKIAVSGNLDQDIEEETVVLTWDPAASNPAAATATLAILDPALNSSGVTTISAVTPALSYDSIIGTLPVTLEAQGDCTRPGGWETPGCSAPFDYDLALADLDDDGYDEIIITGTVLSDITNPRLGTRKRGWMWIFDDSHSSGAGQLKLLSLQTLSGESDGSGNPRGLMVARVAAGSMKQDGSKQIVVAWFDSTDWASAWCRGAGNNNQCGIPQFHYQLFSYLADRHTINEIGKIQRTDQGTSILTMSSWAATSNLLGVAMADLDGDGVQELVLGGWNTSWESGINAWGAQVRLEARGNLDRVTSSTDAAALPLRATSASPMEVNISFNQPPSRWLTSLTTFSSPSSPGASRTQQLIAGNNIASWGKNNGSPAVTTFLWNVGLPSRSSTVNGKQYSYATTVNSLVDAPAYYAFVAGQGSNFLYPTHLDVRAGDVNGDGRDDVILFNSNGKIDVWGWNCVDNKDPCTLGWTNFYTRAAAGGPAMPNAVLSPAAADRDSTTVEYAQEHTIIYTNNRIIALLASPPAVDPAITDPSGIPVQNSGNMFSVFGTMQGITSTRAVTAGVHGGVLVGVDMEVTVGLIASVTLSSFRVGVTSEIEGTHTSETSRTTTFTVEYGEGIGADGVLYSTMPYDRYTYTIRSSLDPNAVGQRFYIDVPQQAQIKLVDRDYFNNVVNAGSFQVTDHLLKDNPYDLKSYPKCTDFPTTKQTNPAPIDLGAGYLVYSTIEPMGFSPPVGSPPTVPPQWSGGSAGGSYATTTLESSQSTSTTWEETLTVDVASEFGLSGALLGFNLGFSVGGYQSTSFESGLSFTGTAGSLLNNYVAQYNYAYRLFGYKQTLSDAKGNAFQSFFVVNYGVDTLGSYWGAPTSTCQF